MRSEIAERDPRLPWPSRAWNIAANSRRYNHNWEFDGWYNRLPSELDTVDGVAIDLGIAPIQLEEMLFQRKVFGIEQDGMWIIPRRQFVHGWYESFRIDEKLIPFWEGFAEQFPNLSKSPWAVWKMLFWKYGGIGRGESHGIIRSMVNCTEEDWPTLSANVRELLFGVDRKFIDKDRATIEEDLEIPYESLADRGIDEKTWFED
mgnify:FL=1